MHLISNNTNVSNIRTNATTKKRLSAIHPRINLVHLTIYTDNTKPMEKPHKAKINGKQSLEQTVDPTNHHIERNFKAVGDEIRELRRFQHEAINNLDNKAGIIFSIFIGFALLVIVETINQQVAVHNSIMITLSAICLVIGTTIMFYGIKPRQFQATVDTENYIQKIIENKQIDVYEDITGTIETKICEPLAESLREKSLLLNLGLAFFIAMFIFYILGILMV